MLTGSLDKETCEAWSALYRLRTEPNSSLLWT